MSDFSSSNPANITPITDDLIDSGFVPCDQDGLQMNSAAFNGMFDYLLDRTGVTAAELMLSTAAAAIALSSSAESVETVQDMVDWFAARDRITVLDYMTDAEIADVKAGAKTLDVTAPILAAIEYARSTGFPVVHFPAGKYLVTDTLMPTVETFGLQLLGEGIFSTEICADHSLGPVIALNRSYGSAQHMTINASAARTAGAVGAGSDMNCGVLYEADDVSGKAVAGMYTKYLRIINQPHSGFVNVGLNQLSNVSDILCQDNGLHGIVMDQGQLTGRANIIYTGLVTLLNCWCVGNGGHGLVVGNPNDTLESPVRFLMLNCEFADNVQDLTAVYSQDECWTRGENIVFETCAFGRALPPYYGAVAYGGRLLVLRSCRYVGCESMVRLIDDPVRPDTHSVLIDGHMVVNNAMNPAIIVDGTQEKYDVTINSYGELSNITTAFDPLVIHGVWNKGAQNLVLRKTADQSVVNSSVLVDDTELTYQLRPSLSYMFSATVIYDGPTIGDLRIGFVGPVGSSVRWDSDGSMYLASADAVAISNNPITEAGSRVFGCAAGRRTANISGFVTVGATGGAFRMQIAQGVPNVAATTVAANSSLRISRENAGVI